MARGAVSGDGAVVHLRRSPATGIVTGNAVAIVVSEPVATITGRCQRLKVAIFMTLGACQLHMRAIELIDVRIVRRLPAGLIVTGMAIWLGAMRMRSLMTCSASPIKPGEALFGVAVTTTELQVSAFEFSRVQRLCRSPRLEIMTTRASLCIATAVFRFVARFAPTRHPRVTLVLVTFVAAGGQMFADKKTLMCLVFVCGALPAPVTFQAVQIGRARVAGTL